MKHARSQQHFLRRCRSGLPSGFTFFLKASHRLFRMYLPRGSDSNGHEAPENTSKQA